MGTTTEQVCGTDRWLAEVYLSGSKHSLGAVGLRFYHVQDAGNTPGGRGGTSFSGSTLADSRRNDQHLGFTIEFARRRESHGRPASAPRSPETGKRLPGEAGSTSP